MSATEKLVKENIALNDIRAKREELVSNVKLLDTQINQLSQNKVATMGAIQVLDQLLEQKESEDNA